MPKLNSCSLEQHQESNSFSLQSGIEEFMDSRFSSILNEVQEEDRKLQLEPSILFSSPLKQKDLLNLNGEMKPHAEQGVGTTDVVLWEKQSSMTFSQSNSNCCPTHKGRCRRTWIANSFGKLIAYTFYSPEWAEEWMAETDIRRTKTIERGEYKIVWALYWFDFWWSIELLLGKIGHIWGQFMGR